MGIRIQILAILGSIALLFIVFDLLRRRLLKEEYSILWLGIASTFLVVSAWRGLLDEAARLIDVHYAPAALFLVLILGAYLLLMHFSLVFSKLSQKNKEIAQELGLLKMELERVKKAQVPETRLASSDPAVEITDHA